MPAINAKNGGFTVFWSADESNRETVKQVLDGMDLSNFTPEPRTAFNALKSALAETVERQGRVVLTALKDNSGIDVANVDQGGKENEFRHWFSVEILNEKSIRCNVSDPGLAAQIRTTFDAKMQTISGAAVGAMLTKIVQAWHGTTLRPTGGFYWLPQEKLSSWQNLENGLALAAGNALYHMQNVYDEGMLRAVGAAIKNEIESECQRMSDEVMSGDLGERALEARKRQAQAMAAKAKAYEAILGTTLDSLKSAIENVEAAAAAAVLQVVAEKEKAEAEENGGK